MRIFFVLTFIVSMSLKAQLLSNPSSLESDLVQMLKKLPTYRPDENGIDLRVKDFNPKEAVLILLHLKAIEEMYSPLALRVNHQMHVWNEALEFHGASHIFDFVSSETFSFQKWLRSYVSIFPDPELIACVELDKLKTQEEIESLKLDLLSIILKSVKTRESVDKNVDAIIKKMQEALNRLPGNKVDARAKYLTKLATMPSQSEKVKNFKDRFEYESRFAMLIANEDDKMTRQESKIFFSMLDTYFHQSILDKKYVYWVKFVPIVKRFNLSKLGKIERIHLGSVSKKHLQLNNTSRKPIFHLYSDGHSEFRIYYSRGEQFRHEVFEVELPLNLIRAWRGLNPIERSKAQKIVKTFLVKFKKMGPLARGRINEAFNIQMSIAPPTGEFIIREDWNPKFNNSYNYLTISKDLVVSGDCIWKAIGFDDWNTSFQKISIKSSAFKLTIENDLKRETLSMELKDYSVGLFGQTLSNEYTYGWKSPTYLQEFSAFSWSKGSSIYIRDFKKGPVLSSLILPNSPWLEKFYATNFLLKKAID